MTTRSFDPEIRRNIPDYLTIVDDLYRFPAV